MEENYYKPLVEISIQYQIEFDRKIQQKIFWLYLILDISFAILFGFIHNHYFDLDPETETKLTTKHKIVLIYEISFLITIVGLVLFKCCKFTTSWFHLLKFLTRYTFKTSVFLAPLVLVVWPLLAFYDFLIIFCLFMYIVCSLMECMGGKK